MPRKQEETQSVESDYGTPEARRQAFHVIEQPDPNDRSTKRVRVEDTISWYERRDYISQKMADALRRYRDDAELSGMLPPIIGNYQQSISGGISLVSDTRMAAQARRNNAIRVLNDLNREAFHLVEAVAVHGQSAGRYMQTKCGVSPNEALNMLVDFSRALSRHYGFMK